MSDKKEHTPQLHAQSTRCIYVNIYIYIFYRFIGLNQTGHGTSGGASTRFQRSWSVALDGSTTHTMKNDVRRNLQQNVSHIWRCEKNTRANSSIGQPQNQNRRTPRANHEPLPQRRHATGVLPLCNRTTGDRICRTIAQAVLSPDVFDLRFHRRSRRKIGRARTRPRHRLVATHVHRLGGELQQR